MNQSQTFITEVDVHDDTALREWYDVVVAAEREGLDDLATVWTFPEVQVMMREPSRLRERHVFVGRAGAVDGPVVASGSVVFFLQDNPTKANFLVCVHPDQRRRGHGAAMLGSMERAALAAGRSLMSTEINWPESFGSDADNWPGREFARKHGYPLTLGEVQRELAIPVDAALLDALASEAATAHEGYEVRSWVGPVPDELALGWETLASSLMTEAPMGDGEHEPEVVDVANLREHEALTAKQGRTMCCAVALTAEGEVAAYTDLAVTPHESGKAYQWGTLVRGSDRGHRLGLAVKVANIRLLQSLDLGVVRVVTWNAEVNDHMIAINERLGFAVVARAGEFQKRLAPRDA
ncbi:MAG: GNAT family N-acetyltransferase [Nocardioides sp.]